MFYYPPEDVCHQFGLVDHHVSHPLFISFHVFLLINCPLNMRSVSRTPPVDWLSGSSLAVNGKSSTGHQRMRTEQVQDKECMSSEQNACQRIATVHPAGAFFRWCLFQVLCMHTFCRIEKTSPDKKCMR